MLDLERPRAGAGDHLHVDLPGLGERGEPDPVDGAGLGTGEDLPGRDLRASVRRVMAMPALARRLDRDRDAERLTVSCSHPDGHPFDPHERRFPDEFCLRE